MKLAIGSMLWVLVAIWFIIIISIIGISLYSTLFSMPVWVKLLFRKISLPLLKRLFAVLALAIGLTALLLSVVNHYKK